MSLARARRLLQEHGWVGPSVEPFCIVRGPGVRMNAGYWEPYNIDPLWLPATTHGTLDPRPYEVVEKFSVFGACLEARADFTELEQSFVQTAEFEDLTWWLERPERREEEVLRLFTSAVLRSKREKRA